MNKNIICVLSKVNSTSFVKHIQAISILLVKQLIG